MSECRRAIATGMAGDGAGDPNAVNEIKAVDVLGQDVGNDQRDFRFRCTLVVPQLGKPDVAPVLGAFRLPKDYATDLALRPDDAMNHVASVLALRDRLDHVLRELGGEAPPVRAPGLRLAVAASPARLFV